MVGGSLGGRKEMVVRRNGGREIVVGWKCGSGW